MTGNLLSEDDLPKTFAPAVRERCAADETDYEILNQRVVSALLMETLAVYRAFRAQMWWIPIRFARLVLLPIVVGFAIWFLASLLAVSLARVDPNVSDWATTTVALSIAVAWCDPRRIVPRARFLLVGSRPRVRRLALGRLETAFEGRRLTRCVCGIGALIGLQTALIQNTPSHAGMVNVERFGQSFLLTLDNACHGVLLDLFELHDLSVAGEYQHTVWSATLFLFFRTGITLLFGLYLFARFTTRKLKTLEIPAFHGDDQEVVLRRWLRDVTRGGDWRHDFGPEFVFLQILRAYLSSEMEEAQQLGHLFHTLKISPELRRLVVDSFGDELIC